MLRGSKQLELGLGRFSATCVILLRVRRGSGMLWAARAAAEAVPHGGAHRRVPFWPRDRLRSTTFSAKRIMGMC
jgi:hypothetical protein